MDLAVNLADNLVVTLCEEKLQYVGNLFIPVFFWLLQVDIDSEKFPDALTEAVVSLCEEKLQYVGNLGIHGIITVVVDTETIITFFSEDFPEREG